jgi:hypothetical protein
MITKPEVGALLLFASGLDRFVQVDRVTTDAWFRVLADLDVTHAQAEQACINHYTGPDAGRPFTVAHVVALVTVDNRTARLAVEADVRSAKARGLVEKSWPPRDLLPERVREALFNLRDLERVAAAERFALDQGPGKPADVGTVGRIA